MALLGQKAENHFVGVNSGILDQYSSAMGQAGCALLLDCRHLTSQVTPMAPEPAGGDLRHARKAQLGRHRIRRAPGAVRRGRAHAPAALSIDPRAARRDAWNDSRPTKKTCPRWWPGAAALLSKRTSACSTWRKLCPAGDPEQLGAALRRFLRRRARPVRNQRAGHGSHDGSHAQRAGRGWARGRPGPVLAAAWSPLSTAEAWKPLPAIPESTTSAAPALLPRCTLCKPPPEPAFSKKDGFIDRRLRGKPRNQ